MLTASGEARIEGCLASGRAVPQCSANALLTKARSAAVRMRCRKRSLAKCAAAASAMPSPPLPHSNSINQGHAWNSLLLNCRQDAKSCFFNLLNCGLVRGLRVASKANKIADNHSMRQTLFYMPESKDNEKFYAWLPSALIIQYHMSMILPPAWPWVEGWCGVGDTGGGPHF